MASLSAAPSQLPRTNSRHNDMTDAENDRPSVSVIIPTFNEAGTIAGTLAALERVGDGVEVIVADGGSHDRTIEIARQLGAIAIAGERGRGTQMNNGATIARGHTLFFLHADTIAPPETIKQINKALRRNPATVGGNLSVRFEGKTRPARFMTWLYPKLAKLGLCYGDSGIFVRAHIYRDIGGFKPFPLFEDLDLIRRLKKRGTMVRLPVELVTSSRRFEGRSFIVTFARWSILQGLYWLGVPPKILSRLYEPLRNAGRQPGPVQSLGKNIDL